MKVFYVAIKLEGKAKMKEKKIFGLSRLDLNRKWM